MERVRDKEDRRRIFVKVRMARLKPLLPKYEAIGNAYLGLLNDYTTAELELICGYLERSSALSRQHLAKLSGDRSELTRARKKNTQSG